MNTLDKAEILGRLWGELLYGNDEQKQFAHMFDISFPLCLLVSDGYVEPMDSAVEMIDDLWTDACEFLEIDATLSFEDFQEFIAKASL